MESSSRATSSSTMGTPQASSFVQESAQHASSEESRTDLLSIERRQAGNFEEEEEEEADEQASQVQSFDEHVDGFHDMDDANDFLVILDFGALQVDWSHGYKLVGLGTETPFIQVGGQIYSGFWSTSLGTEMAFDRRTGQHEHNITRRIKFRPAVPKVPEGVKTKPLRMEMLRKAPDGTVDTLENIKKRAEEEQARQKAQREQRRRQRDSGAMMDQRREANAAYQEPQETQETQETQDVDMSEAV